MSRDYIGLNGIKQALDPAIRQIWHPRTFFGYVKGKLIGYRAETLSALLVRIRVILAEIPREILNAVFREWMERLQKCVQVDGEDLGGAKRTQYIETDFNREIRLCYAGLGIPYIIPGIVHFFQWWYPSFLEKGLDEAVRLCGEATEIPISDYLYLWKSFCSKVKNHPISVTPDSLDDRIDSSLLEEMLRLGPPLMDRSSVGKMRDSYAVTLFTLDNCLKCFESGDLHSAVFLLPGALQKELIRSTSIPRGERLFKAIVSFKHLMRFFICPIYRMLPE